MTVRIMSEVQSVFPKGGKKCSEDMVNAEAERKAA
jgi:hypothetical protein